MLKNKVIFGLLILINFSTSCATKQKLITIKPEPETSSAPLVLDNIPSFINVPVSIKLKDIENQINNTLKDLIYEDNNILDDDIEIKVWKQAPITLKTDATSANKITTILPLKAKIKHRIGTQTLGLNLYKTNEINLNGQVTLTSKIRLTNWKLNSNTNISNLHWKESPSMIVFGKKVPVTYLVNPALKLFRNKIEKSIDDAIETSMDFKPNVLDAIEKIAVPFKMSDTYESWLQVVPLEIYTTDAQLKNDNILLQMGMKCNLESIIGQEPESKFNAKNIVLKPVTKMPNHVTSNIVAISTYQDASKIMTKNFSGQEFGSGKKKVTVNNVSIWHKQGKMVIALDLQGSINGSVYLEGVPFYNNVTKELFFDNLEYVLDTKSQLLKTANWLAKGIILKRIQESCRYSMQPNLDEGKQTMLGYLNNYSPIPGVFVNGKLNDIEFQRIQLTNTAILAFLKVTGNISVTVDGLK